MKMKTTLRVAALIAAAAVATPAFAGDTQVKGKVFFDYGTKTITAPNGTKTTTTGSNLSRTYLTVKHKLDDTWKVRLTLDSAQEATLKKKTSIYVKYANLTGSFSDAFNVSLGVIETPWIGHEDHLGGHRYISKSFVDAQGLDSSADAGIVIYGKVADGLVNYAVAEVNGGGYGNITRTSSQDLNARIGFAPVEGLTIDLGFRDGYKGAKTNSTIPTTGLTKHRLTQVMVTYGMGHDFRVGANYIKAEEKTNNVTETLKGLDAWAWYNFTDQFGAFVNYETAKSSTGNAVGKLTGAATEKTTIVSLDYKASKKVKLSVAYTSIKGLKGVAGEKETIAGVYSQFKF